MHREEEEGRGTGLTYRGRKSRRRAAVTSGKKSSSGCIYMRHQIWIWCLFLWKCRILRPIGQQAPEISSTSANLTHNSGFIKEEPAVILGLYWVLRDAIKGKMMMIPI